jgi:hypothetical protein
VLKEDFIVSSLKVPCNQLWGQKIKDGTAFPQVDFPKKVFSAVWRALG